MIMHRNLKIKPACTWLDLMSALKLSVLGSGELRILLDSDENGDDPIPETVIIGNLIHFYQLHMQQLSSCGKILKLYSLQQCRIPSV